MRSEIENEDTLQLVPQRRDHEIEVGDWGSETSVGLIRKENEDTWGHGDNRIFVVADGMGGTEGGKRASQLAVHGLLRADPIGGWVQAVRRLNTSVHAACTAEGMPTAGTTISALIVDHKRCVTINVGDSRVYRCRNGVVEAITTDHTLGMVRKLAGLDPEGQDPRGGQNALTSYIGSPDDSQQIDIGTVSAMAGDRFMLCTDGAHRQLEAEKLAEMLIGYSCAESAGLIVSAADEAGGRDNATAVVVDLVARIKE